MTNDMYFSDAYRSLHKITENGEEILEYLRKGKLVTSLPIDGQFKFWVRIPEQYWIDTGMEGIRPLRFPKEFKNHPFKIKVAVILPLLVPTLEKIVLEQIGADWETVRNLGNSWFFGEMEQSLFDPPTQQRCSEILDQIKMGLFLSANTSIRPKCSTRNFKNVEQIAQVAHGIKVGRPLKLVEHDEFWVMVIKCMPNGTTKKQSAVVDDVYDLIQRSDLSNKGYSKYFITEKIKVFWKDIKI